MADCLVEVYAPGKSRLEDLIGAARAFARAERRAGRDVRYMRSIFVPCDETCFHVFRAASALELQDAARGASFDIERVVETLQ